MIHKRVNGVLRLVGMEDRQTAFPPSLSGGEQQRVAIARAIIGDPKIILADEPTGNLDSVAADVVLDLLVDMRARQGSTLVLVTHDPAIAGRADRRVHLREGRIEREERG